jgi:tetratricopeptide (TPR) repeat protein
MSRKRSRERTHPMPKAVLRLLDLDQAKSAVLNSLTSTDAQRGYRHAIDEFVEWYCSEPRLSFSRTVVLRYRIHLESRHLAPGTVNLRLGAVRRLAYEAADCGLLSPDLAAGIRRVKGVKKIGVRLGNWLTAEQSQRLWQAPRGERLKERRDRALLAILLACGVRRMKQLNSTSAIFNSVRNLRCLARRYDEGLERVNTALELDPSFLPFTYVLGTVHMFKGDEQAAFAAYNRGVDVSARAGSYLGGLGWGYARVGRKEDARMVLTQLCDMRRQKYVMATNIALIHAELDEKEEALRWLEQGFEERAPWMVYLNTDPRYDSLRLKLRFQELLRRMKFPT